MGIVTWHQSIGIAVSCAIAAVVLRGVRRTYDVALVRFLIGLGQEGSLIFSLFALWQVAGRLARTRVDGAFDRAHRLWDLERATHLDPELWLQHHVLPHPWLVKAMNVYYLYGHLNVMIALLLWLFLLHRTFYPAIRNVLAVSSLICLLIQMLPVAPPRMLADEGFVDTALLYGQSVYGSMGSGIANQLSAMPSLHQSWSALVAIAVVRASRSRWRWLIVLHPLTMAVVIMTTANHWLLDGVVSVAVVLVVLLVEDWRRARALGWAQAQQSRRRSGEPDPVLAQSYDIAG